MEHANHITGWVCDLSRVSYNLCHHLVKLSIVVVSFDRLFSIKFPYTYDEKYGTKRNMVVLLVTCWFVTIAVDMMPFIHEIDDDVCHYVPSKEWLLFIIIVYNITPFALIAMNYILIWAIAAKLALYDHKQRTSIARSFKNISISKYPSSDKKLKSSHKKSSQCREKGKLKFMLELKATKTSLALIGVYVFCWGPLGIYMMIDTVCQECLSLNDHTSKYIIMILKYLCFSSNLLAPLCYCWASKEYRKAGKRICKKVGLLRVKTMLSVSRRGNCGTYNDDVEMVDLDYKV